MEKNSFIILAVWFLLLSFSAISYSTDTLTLPVYELTIDPAYLDSLEANPASPITYPAILEYEGESFDCRVCYRGASSLNLPKRSWKVEFDFEGPFGRKETILNSEYRDISVCRNRLAMSIADEFGLMTPDMRHISFIINDLFRGVFLEVEPVDLDFFARRGYAENPYFKAITHNARFAPIRNSESWPYHYYPYEYTTEDSDTLGARIAFIQFGDPDSVGAHLSDMFVMEDLLNYFALQFCLHNYDGFAKNFYLYQFNDYRYHMVPWDCDATFGNDYQGNYVGGTNDLTFAPLTCQAVFQRMIGVPEYNEEFLSVVNEMSGAGFDSAALKIEQYFYEIRNDVYQDTFKRGSNEEFDNELWVILEYLEERSEALDDLDWFHRIEGKDYSANPSYISSLNDSVLFQIKILGPANGCFLKLDDIYGENAYYMNDEGIFGDSIAGDRIFSIKTTLAGIVPPAYYTFLIKSSPFESYPVPPAGNFDLTLYPISLPSVRLNASPPVQGEITVGPFWLDEVSNTSLIGLVNTSGRSLDLSGLVTRVGGGCEFAILRELPLLPAGDTLFVSNHLDIAQTILPQNSVTGNLYFVPYAGDTVSLETFSGQVIASSIVDFVTLVGEAPGQIVINEINYHSDEDFDPGDWVELYAVSGTTNLQNWRFRDGRIDHVFLIPGNTVLTEGNYLILCSDTLAFKTCFPYVERIKGNWGFSLSASGDMVRLYNNLNLMVDCVVYDDNYPWPIQPDGNGPTLELVNPALPNYNYEYWEASALPFGYGTPGAANSVFNSVPHYLSGLPSGFHILGVYPNPFNNSMCIRFQTEKIGNAEIKIFDILGREVKKIDYYSALPGEHRVEWDGKNANSGIVSSGIYFIQTEFEGKTAITKAALVR